VNSLSNNEDTAPDPLQFILIIVAAVVGAIYATRRRAHAVYLGALVAAFVLFAFVLRWQPWHSRLELPLMVLGAPLVGAVFSLAWAARATATIAGLLVICAVPWLGGPSIRPLLGPQSILVTDRSILYFAAWPELRTAYQSAAEDAHSTGCQVVGIVGGGDIFEYPLWVYLGQGYRVVSVQPAPGTEHLGRSDPQPCLTFEGS
jgi:hypothetical protein